MANELVLACEAFVTAVLSPGKGTGDFLWALAVPDLKMTNQVRKALAGEFALLLHTMEERISGEVKVIPFVIDVFFGGIPRAYRKNAAWETAQYTSTVTFP